MIITPTLCLICYYSSLLAADKAVADAVKYHNNACVSQVSAAC